MASTSTLDDWKNVQTMYETPATLTSKQAVALKEIWAVILAFFDVGDGLLLPEWPKFFPLADGEEQDPELVLSLKSFTGTLFRDEFYSLLRHDYADYLPLRFLKARLYDKEKAAKMLVNALAFRRRNIPKAMLSEVGGDAEFLAAMKKAKSFVPCYDNHGRTITCIRMRNHARGDCSLDCFERYILYQMEHAHLLHKPLQDRTVLLVDMTGFSVTTLDISAIKFLILNFEQYYPEELYEGIIHNAPWLFSSAWALIKPLLRQATRDKITFTSNLKELSSKIGEAQADLVLKTELNYLPRPQDEKFKDESQNLNNGSDECKAAFKAWDDNRAEVEELTRQFCRPAASDTPLEEIKELESKRSEACWKLSKSYWAIDPFIRPKSYLDRSGFLPPSDTSSLNLDCKSQARSKPSTPTLSRPPSARN